METQPTLDDAIASCQATANAMNQTIRVNIGGIDMEFSPASTEPKQEPKATTPKAKATPTKRKESEAQKMFRANILEGKYAKRRANDVWKATKPDYMFGVSYTVALRKGWAKKDGTISKKGEKMTNLTARQVAALYPRRR